MWRSDPYCTTIPRRTVSVLVITDEIPEELCTPAEESSDGCIDDGEALLDVPRSDRNASPCIDVGDKVACGDNYDDDFEEDSEAEVWHFIEKCWSYHTAVKLWSRTLFISAYVRDGDVEKTIFQNYCTLYSLMLWSYIWLRMIYNKALTLFKFDRSG